MANVEIKNLTKKFGDLTVLDQLNLEIPDGTLVSLLGSSGCGKTTTLRLIAGFEQANEGEIYIGEERINDIPVHKRNIGMVFQSYALFPHMTVWQNVAYGLEQRKLGKDEIKKKVDAILNLVKLSDYGMRKPKQLSGGQQQRVALARALVTEPSVLLLDECLSALDKKLRVEMQVELRGILEKTGITALFVTHDQEEAMTLSDWIVVMNRGRVEQMGKPYEVYEHPKNSFVAGFLGKVNFFEGRVVEADKNTVTLEMSCGTSQLNVNEVSEAGKDAVYAIRPEKLHVKKLEVKDESATELRNKLGLIGTVQFITYSGNLSTYTIDCNGKTVLAEVQNQGKPEEIKVGDKVHLSWENTSCMRMEEQK